MMVLEIHLEFFFTELTKKAYPISTNTQWKFAMTVGWNDPLDAQTKERKKYKRFSVNTWSLQRCQDNSCATGTVHKDANCTASGVGKPLVSCGEKLVMAIECGVNHLTHTFKYVLYQENIGLWAGWKFPPNDYSGFDIYSDKYINYYDCTARRRKANTSIDISDSRKFTESTDFQLSESVYPKIYFKAASTTDDLATEDTEDPESNTFPDNVATKMHTAQTNTTMENSEPYGSLKIFPGVKSATDDLVREYNEEIPSTTLISNATKTTSSPKPSESIYPKTSKTESTTDDLQTDDTEEVESNTLPSTELRETQSTNTITTK